MSNLFKYILTIVFFLSHLITAQESKNPLFSSFGNYIKAKDNTPFQVKWISAGPVTNSARVEALQGDPNQPGTMYVAFGSGNLWKTTNNGLDWKPIFENQPTLGIGDIAIAPSNSKILYLGTGESLRKNRNFTMPGTGVYRSDDGGETWTHLGLEETWHISEIVVHPYNPDIVFVAAMGKFWSESTSKGIYRTINGGKDWEHVLYIDKNTRANDIVIAHSNPKIVYASMWENNDNTNIAESVYGPNSSIYYSSDGGSTWKRSMDGLPDDPKIGRIGLAVSYQNAQKVYALMDNRNQTEGNSAEVYQSLNGGVTWKKTHKDTLRIFPGNNIGWYFADIYVSPKNDDEIYSLGVRMAHSKDGGKIFSTVGGNIQHLQPSPAQTLHLDHCELWINPINPNHLALGNDGGLYVTYDKGANWLHLNNIPTGEFYDITLDNQKPYNIYGGVQDNATVYGPAKEWNPHGQDVWKYLWIDAWSGGDGCVTQVDPNDHNTVYFSRQHGDGLRKDMNADTSITIGPSRKKVSNENNLKYNFVSPYFISPHDSKTLYHGANHVIKSSDRGDSWKIISGNIAESSKPEKKSWAAGAITESELKPGLLYVGTDHGAFWVSKNSGKSWKEYSDGLPNAYIRSIQPSNFKKSRVYLTMTGLNYDDLNNYIFVSENYGKTWNSITADLPNDPANVIQEDLIHQNILYTGTYRGVYISVNRGKSWNLLGNNMPAVSVADLAIQKRENELVVGTHGRGIYYLSLNPIHQAFQLNTSEKDEYHLFNIPQAQYPKQMDTSKDIDQSTIVKLPISFWSPQKEMINISIIDQNKKNTIWEINFMANMGLNQLRWNLILETQHSDLPYFKGYQKYIQPGTYGLQLQIGNKTMQKNLTVKNYY